MLNNKEKIIKFIKKSLSSNYQGFLRVFVPSNKLNMIKELLGFDSDVNLKLYLHSNSFRHIRNNHGKQKPNEIPMTEEMMCRIVDVLETPFVEFKPATISNENNGDAIILSKKFDDGTTSFLLVSFKNNLKKLKTQTGYTDVKGIDNVVEMVVSEISIVDESITTNGLAGVVKYLNIGDWTWVKGNSYALQIIGIDLEKKQYQLSDGSFVSAVGFAKNKIAAKEMYEIMPIYSVGDNLVCTKNDKSFKVVGYCYSLRYKEIRYKSDILWQGATLWVRECDVKESDGYKYGYGQLLFIKGKSKKSIDYFYLADRKKENGKELYNFGGDVWYTSDQIMNNDEFTEYLKNANHDSELLRTEIKLLDGKHSYPQTLLKKDRDLFIQLDYNHIRDEYRITFFAETLNKYPERDFDIVRKRSISSRGVSEMGNTIYYAISSEYFWIVNELQKNGYRIQYIDDLSGTDYPVEWGVGLGSTDYPVESGEGLGDIGDSLLSAEMQLLKIKKMGDFGEKIGGSAKDRFAKGAKTPAAKKEKKTMEYLPLDDDTTSYDYMSFKNLRSLNYKPSVSYFQKVLKLNKIVSRVLYLYYYLKDLDSLHEIKTIIANSEIQSDITEAVIDNKQLSKRYDPSDSIKLPSGHDSVYILISRFICNLVHYGLALEKTLGEDNFDWNIVRKIKISGTIIIDTTWSDEARQFYFNYSYGVVKNNDTLLCLLLNCLGRPLISSTFKNLFGGWSLKSSDKYVRLDYAGTIKYDDFKERYVELFKEGIKLYEAKYGPVHKEDDKWHYEDKAGLFAKLREGDDYRMGRNAEPKDFIDTFGFRAVEFGETMPQKERWEHMNRTYDAFMDLSKILGVEPRFISLNKLGLCFGSRGRGGKNAASAHFEPVKFVINLTRKNGAGSLAHEWMHALDTALIHFKLDCHHLSDAVRARVKGVDYYLDRIRLMSEYGNVNRQPPFVTSFYNYLAHVYNRPSRYNFFSDALRLDQKRKDPYWGTPTEMMARSFEFYIIERLKRNNQVNEYLAQIPERKATDLAYPYPYNEDKDLIMEDYDDIFNAISNTQYELMEEWSNS